MKTPLLVLLAALALAGCQTVQTPSKLAVGANPESVTRGFDGDLFVSLMGPSRKAGDGDGKIVRVSASGFNDTDEFCPVWRLFDLLPEGAADWRPKQTYG